MSKQYFLGLDISGTSTGYAVLSRDLDGSIVAETSGYIATSSKETDGQRMSKIRDRIEILFHMYPITEVIRERGFSKGHRSTQLIFKAIGVAEETANRQGFPFITEYTPAAIKKAVTGNGKAEKEEVESGVRSLIEIPWAFKRNDESDAVAIVLTHFKMKGWL